MIMNNPRTTEHPVDSMFTDRWSPRSFLQDPIPPEQIAILFEAARWAPSSSNEQPWRFYYAVGEAARRRFAETLVPANRVWASSAPLLIYVTSTLRFRRSGEINRWHGFDAGAAWMSLALQARRLGLYSHAMGGFDRRKAAELLNIDDREIQIHAAVAVGRRGDAGQLPEALQSREQPNTRMPVSDFIVLI